MRWLLAFGASFLATWALVRRWRPTPQHLSADTLADIARREDTSGLGEINDKDAHPYAVQSMRVVRRGTRA